MNFPKSRISILLFLPIAAGILMEGLPNEPQNDRELAIVLRFVPKVSIQNGEEVVTLELSRDKARKLYDGDTLETGDKGYAQVVFLDKSTAKVKPNSQLIVRGEAGTQRKVFSTRIDLNKGKIKLNVTPQGANDFEVSTAKSLASVKGTIFGSDSEGYHFVQEGEIEVTALNSGLSATILQNQFARVDPNGDEIETGDLSDEELEQLNEGFQVLDAEFEEKEIILRFRDSNGQLREERIKYYEKQDN
jgi:hypothetical protein